MSSPLFVIFDVEVAFFFPWAEVFGKANALASLSLPADAAGLSVAEVNTAGRKLAELAPPYEEGRARDRAERWASMTQEELDALDEPSRRVLVEDLEQTRAAAHTLGWLAFGEILVFFGVLLVGFAYLWRRGDLAWVRSLADRTGPGPDRSGAASPSPQPATRALEMAGPRS